MSPRQISFLTSHAEGAWSAQEQRHFEGKPFEAEVASSMPFYGATVGEEARLRASAEAKAASPRRKHRPDALNFPGSDSPIWRTSPDSDSNESNESTESAESTTTNMTSKTTDSTLSKHTQEESDATSPETSEHGDGDLKDGTTPKLTPAPAADVNTNPHMPESTPSQPPSPALPTSLPFLPNTQLYPNLHIKSTKPAKKYRYGTPEMPRGNANLPHRPVSVLNPRTAGHVKHLPRAEKLPLSGYELLASQLSAHGKSSGGSSTSKRRGSIASTRSDDSLSRDVNIKPLYRKFESLNHRILLHLQDELSELEEQLHRLDTADTQTRRLQSHILPASRRAEASSGGELQWHKTDILGKIGYKLGQYNHVLSSFTETQQLSSPTMSDVNSYRSYLDTQQPIAEIETRFLDASDDLVMLATKPAAHGGHAVHASHTAHAAPQRPRRMDESSSESSLSPYMQTLREPMEPLFLRCPSPESSLSDASSAPSAPMSSSVLSERDAPASSYSDKKIIDKKSNDKKSKSKYTTAHQTQPIQDNFLHLVVALAVAVVVPVLTFSMIPTFSGRIAVVLLVAFTVFGAQVQAETVRTSEHAHPTGRHNTRDLVCCAAAYGAVMSVVAGACA